MLTPEGCRRRRQRLWEALAPRPDLIVVTDPRRLAYFANYYPSPFVFRGEGAAAALILTPDGGAVLLADSTARPFAAEAFVDRAELPVWYDGVHSAGPRKSAFATRLAEFVANLKPKTLGAELSTFPLATWRILQQKIVGIAAVDVEPVVHRLQRAKDADELATIKAAIRAAEAGYAAARKSVTPGMTELDAYLLIQSACQRVAGTQAIVYGDFVSGPRCETGGGPPSDRRIERGDLLLLDFSVVLRGYRGDFAGTFAVQDRANDRVRHAHMAAMQALEAGERALLPGKPCKEIAATVRGVLERSGFGAYFKSHVGHGIGLGHPDPPYIVAESDDVLEVGDVVTLEPGVFVPGELGLRVERNYYIGANGPKTLTRHDLSIDGV